MEISLKMTRSTFGKYIFYFCLFLIIFLLDRISKIYILSMSNEETLNIYVNDFLSIILIWNTGIGFGLFSSSQEIFYNIITVVISFINILIIFLIITSDRLRSFFYVIILGGSAGNLFDRLYYSAVPDFIDLNYRGFHWFVFNVADIFISLGIICLIIRELLEYKKKNV